MKKQLINYSLLGLVVVTLVVPQGLVFATPPTPIPTILSVNPGVGAVGTIVTVLGNTFSPTENRVLLHNPQNDSYYSLAVVPASIVGNGSQLSFTIPETATWPFCVTETPCPQSVPSQRPIPAGNYHLRILANNVLGNLVEFKITERIDPRPDPSLQTGTIKIAVVDQSTGTNLVARVEVRNFDSGTLVGTQETTGGSAIFTNLPIGAYIATAIKDGYYQIEKAFFKIQAGVNESVIIFMAPLGVRPVPPEPPKPPIDLCPFSRFPILQKGVRGDEVKKLQEILGLPVDSQTGYFGPITEREVIEKKQELGLPPTGVIDPDVRPYFFPCYQIVVTSPQAGENWQAGIPDIFYEIRWIIERPIYARPLGATRLQELSRDVAPPSPTTVAPSNVITPLPIPATLSIDLVRFGGLVYHIDYVTLTSDGSYRWSIPSGIASGRYRIRVSLGETPVFFERGDLEKRVYLPEWRGWLWGESGDFTITNQTTPPPNPRLKEQLQQLLQLVEQMQRLLLAIISSL